jgi:hypothetical protein
MTILTVFIVSTACIRAETADLSFASSPAVVKREWLN